MERTSASIYLWALHHGSYADRICSFCLDICSLLSRAGNSSLAVNEEHFLQAVKSQALGSYQRGQMHMDGNSRPRELEHLVLRQLLLVVVPGAISSFLQDELEPSLFLRLPTLHCRSCCLIGLNSQAEHGGICLADMQKREPTCKKDCSRCKNNLWKMLGLGCGRRVGLAARHAENLCPNGNEIVK